MTRTCGLRGNGSPSYYRKANNEQTEAREAIVQQVVAQLLGSMSGDVPAGLGREGIPSVRGATICERPEWSVRG